MRQRNIDAFVNDPGVAIAVCSLTAAGVGINLQVASNLVLAELSWTAAEQTQAIDRSHRIGQSEPVTAWRVIAAQTIDAKIAELIDSKAGLAAQALDGSDEEVGSSADVQHEALVALLTDALSATPGTLDRPVGAAQRPRFARPASAGVGRVQQGRVGQVVDHDPNGFGDVAGQAEALVAGSARGGSEPAGGVDDRRRLVADVAGVVAEGVRWQARPRRRRRPGRTAGPWPTPTDRP